MLNLFLNGNYISAFTFALAAVISIVLHEVAHGYAAIKSGDLTPKYYGRMTLNPVKHFDILGFVMFATIGFGWAKPVPVNTNNFHNYRKGMLVVSLAGVTVNIILAFFAYPLYKLLYQASLFAGDSSQVFYDFASSFFKCMHVLNLSLFTFNLFPVYPLDGFRFLESRMRYNNKFLTFMRRNSLYIFIALIFVLSFTPFNLIYLIENYVALPIKWFWGLII